MLNLKITIDVVYMLLYTKDNLNEMLLIIYIFIHSNIRSTIRRQS